MSKWQYSDILRSLYGYSADIAQSRKIRKEGKRIDKRALLKESIRLKDTNREKSDDYLILYLFLKDKRDFGEYRTKDEEEEFRKYNLDLLEEILKSAPRKKKRALSIAILILLILVVIGISLFAYYEASKTGEERESQTDIEDSLSLESNNSENQISDIQSEESPALESERIDKEDNKAIKSEEIEENIEKKESFSFYLLDNSLLSATLSEEEAAIDIPSSISTRYAEKALLTLMELYSLDESLLKLDKPSFSGASFIFEIPENLKDDFRKYFPESLEKLKSLLDEYLIEDKSERFSIEEPIKLEIALYSDRAYITSPLSLSESEVLGFIEFAKTNLAFENLTYSLPSPTTLLISFDKSDVLERIYENAIKSLNDYIKSLEENDKEERSYSESAETIPISDSDGSFLYESESSEEQNAIIPENDSDISPKRNLETENYQRSLRKWIEEKNSLSFVFSPYTLSYVDFFNSHSDYRLDQTLSSYGLSFSGKYMHYFTKSFSLGFDASFRYSLMNSKSPDYNYEENVLRRNSNYTILINLDFGLRIPIKERMDVDLIFGIGGAWTNMRLNKMVLQMELFLEAKLEAVFSYRISEHFRVNAGIEISALIPTEQFTSPTMCTRLDFLLPNLSFTYIV